MTYRGDTFTGRLNLQGYQLATTTDVTPYNRLPQVTFDGFLPYNPGGLKFDYKTEFVRFDRTSMTDTTSRTRTTLSVPEYPVSTTT